MSIRPGKAGFRVGVVRFVVAVLVLAAVMGADAPGTSRVHTLFAQFDLPDGWEERFWADPLVKALRSRDAKALAGLVPVQAGVRFCRCPACDAEETDDPLVWSIAKPDVLTCRRCGISVPNDKYPAKDEKEKKVPEEAVKVLPGVTHHYPYHAVEADKQRYPDERLYLAAKRDYEARQFLAKAALYAAVRYHEQPARSKDPALARLAAVLVLRFAQVYPAYATHYDQPGSPKFFQKADLPPPYRRGYRTGKWDWTASLDVPLNLVIAYALIRDDPALAEAGRQLGDPHPAKTIERDLFRTSSEFVRLQPEEYSEASLNAYRGLLAVGRLLDDPTLVHEALTRFGEFAERGFYHDGLWRQGDAASHRRVLSLIDGWIGRLLLGYAEPAGLSAATPLHPTTLHESGIEVPMLSLARAAGSAVLSDPTAPEIQQTAWPAAAPSASPRRPALLGGAGLARLALGEGTGALDLELRGQDSLAAPHFQRQALRLAVGGRPVLGDLDELAPLPTGWDRATASHNTVVVDGLNQRESPMKAAEPARGGDFQFFAADPDFQVVSLDDRRAYPQSTTRYRQTIVAVASPSTRFAVSVFDVEGGLQHDQIFHASAGTTARWRLAVPSTPGPSTLLPPSISYVPSARPEDGRWFVQAYGEFTPLAQCRLTRPSTALLDRAGGPGVRLHFLGDAPMSLLTATSPDPLDVSPADPAGEPGRSALIVRRRSKDGTTLRTMFVTLFEPAGGQSLLKRVGRAGSPDGSVVLYVETADGPEHLVINREPGHFLSVTLADGRTLSTDAIAVRVRPQGIILAGGTFVDAGDQRIRHEASSGAVVGVVRQASQSSRGWFEANTSLADPEALAGRVLSIAHGDGTTRAWTLVRVENTATGARLHVREEPGFVLDRAHSGEARYYQFPRTVCPGPHRFSVARMSRL
jgi:hypothetical protein